MKRRVWSVVAVALVPLLLVMCANDGDGPTPPPTTVGVGGAGGCPDNALPEPLYTIHLGTEDDAALPPATTVDVRWSAGDEPPFALDDKSTWTTLEDGVNRECEVDADGPPPTDLDTLTCELWTAGTTEIQVQAPGYLPLSETLTPRQLEGCDEPVPSDVELLLIVDPEA